MNPTAIIFFLALGLVSAAPAEVHSGEAEKQDLHTSVYHLTETVENLTRKFEIIATSTSSDQVQKLKLVNEECSSLTTNLSTAAYDLKNRLANLGTWEEHSFMRKIMTEFELLTVARLGRQLKAVQLEILGITSGISRVPNYQFSERIFLFVNTVLENHINAAFGKLADVDQAIEESKHLNNGSTGHLEPATRAKVIKLLKEFGVQMAATKKALVGELYGEVEAMRLRGEELGLQIHFGFEYAVDVFNFAINFAAQNVEMMEKFTPAPNHHENEENGLKMKFF